MRQCKHQARVYSLGARPAKDLLPSRDPKDVMINTSLMLGSQSVHTVQTQTDRYMELETEGHEALPKMAVLLTLTCGCQCFSCTA